MVDLAAAVTYFALEPEPGSPSRAIRNATIQVPATAWTAQLHTRRLVLTDDRGAATFMFEVDMPRDDKEDIMKFPTRVPVRVRIWVCGPGLGTVAA